MTTKVSDMKASDVLKAAKEKILTDGWAHGWDELDGKAHCPVTAVSSAARKLGCSEWTPFLIPLRKAVGNDFVFPWNDAPERTLTDVLDAFDHAYKLAREDEALAHAPSTKYEDTSMEVEV